ncbi:MAG TPA: hypothetical protein VLM38_06865, partial [Blastocatellia bacterium]|nr:hypothetical protein [Blastocatellia bacterium]
MDRKLRLLTIALILAALANASYSQTQNKTRAKNKQGGNDGAVSIQAASLPVQGGGTIGRLPKWTGFTSSFSAIGDSTIFENKNGLVGIGTDFPTSKLTVQGMVETTLGGFKFPDGTLQTTAAVTGTIGIVHDSTLAGDGTSGSPLMVAVPLILSGSVSNGNGVITVTNTAAGGPAIFGVGGNASGAIGGGAGLLTLGGTGMDTSPGGVGLVGFGGSASTSAGGTGGSLIGGVSTGGNGGDGLFAVGALGVGMGKKGGRGIVAIPGGGAGGATAGLAGEFLGDVEISGNLSKGGGSFKIDHPLDPENKYLYHSFVESPDMMNIYNGNITTDEDGNAVVSLPDWFQALNKDFRYQLTVVGTFAQAIIGEKIKGNRFTIKTSAPGVEVSWQVTGIRKDAYANRHRIQVEETKPEAERGYFLHPEAFDQPEEKGVMFVNNAE